MRHAVLFLSLLTLFSCKKGEELANRPPNTKLVVDAINLSGEDRLNSSVTLSWYGTDEDGYVTGFELSLNNTDWTPVNRQDSTFLFSLEAGQDTADIELWVRAIDNDQVADPSPAYLRIPIQNTPPVALFNPNQTPPDTSLVAATVGLLVNDPDGDETISKLELRFNNGTWMEVPRNTFLATFVLSTTPGNAEVFLGTSTSPLSAPMDGLLPDAMNALYVRCTDLAGAESPADTLEFFFRNRTSDLLVVCGQAPSARDVYLSVLQNLSISYDLLDYYPGWDAVPHYWTPTFTQILAKYNKLFIFTDGATLSAPNPVTGEENNLMVFAAPAIQPFVDAGGKVLATMSFSSAFDATPLYGALPIDGLVLSAGQARIQPDSGMYTVDAVNPADYPDVFPTFVDFGVDPVVAAVDAEPFYRARLTKLSGWNGDNLMGVRRRNNLGQVNQVFFSVEMHKYNGNLPALTDLFDQLLNNDLDW